MFRWSFISHTWISVSAHHVIDWLHDQQHLLQHTYTNPLVKSTSDLIFRWSKLCKDLLSDVSILVDVIKVESPVELFGDSSSQQHWQTNHKVLPADEEWAKFRQWWKGTIWRMNCEEIDLTSKRIEPFLSRSNALNRKWAYVVASEETKWRYSKHGGIGTALKTSSWWRLWTTLSDYVYYGICCTPLRKELRVDGLESFFIDQTAWALLKWKDRDI